MAGGTIVLLGLSTSSYFWFANQKCSSARTNSFYKSSLNISESILDCKEKDRNYSIFLDIQKDSMSNSEDTLSFKVVDNNDNGKVRWGLGVESNQRWTNWGIAMYKNNNQGTNGELFSTTIRVPRVGNNYDKSKSWTSLTVSCQKSLLKLKNDWNKGCERCGGRYLMSENMKFEIQDNNVKIPKVFDWKDNFQPKIIFCSS